MSDSRLVYSTEFGRTCAECGKPVNACGCKKEKKTKKAEGLSGFPDDGIIRIRREVKGRKGKTVTAVFGMPLAEDELKLFAKKLKQRCGTGGAIKDGVIVFQGDHRDTLLDEIQKMRYKVKIAG